MYESGLVNRPPLGNVYVNVGLASVRIGPRLATALTLNHSRFELAENTGEYAPARSMATTAKMKLWPGTRLRRSSPWALPGRESQSANAGAKRRLSVSGSARIATSGRSGR